MLNNKVLRGDWLIHNRIATMFIMYNHFSQTLKGQKSKPLAGNVLKSNSLIYFYTVEELFMISMLAGFIS